MAKNKQKLLCIGGPSGVGKTDLSIKLAKLFNGEIVSCDSMQIYKGFDIGTAKITNNEMGNIKHYMIDICEPMQSFSVKEYKDEAIKTITHIEENGKLPIMVGGTGLYINAVLYDYNFSEENKDDTLRAKYNNLAHKYGNIVLISELKNKNINFGKVHYNDTKRLIRLLETNGQAGLCDDYEKESKYDFFYVCLFRDRAELYNILDKRVDKMFSLGLKSEVENLLHLGVTFDCQAMQSIGYKEFKPYFDGEVKDLSLIKEKIKKNTRNYAKRQLTWFRNSKGVLMYDVGCGFDELIKKIGEWLKK